MQCVCVCVYVWMCVVVVSLLFPCANSILFNLIQSDPIQCNSFLSTPSFLLYRTQVVTHFDGARGKALVVVSIHSLLVLLTYTARLAYLLIVYPFHLRPLGVVGLFFHSYPSYCC